MPTRDLVKVKRRFLRGGEKMVRLSRLRNLPVVCENRKVGFLQSVSLDEAQKRVTALIVSCGLRGKRMALPEQVISMTGGFILVSKTEKYKRELEAEWRRFVRSVSGVLAGRVVDCAIEERTLGVIALEMIRGYLPAQRRNPVWLYAYHCSDELKEIMISACPDGEPIGWREV